MPPSTGVTRDRSTRVVSRSTTSSRATVPPGPTSSAAARSNPSRWTASRRSRRRSGSLSGSQLQSRVARSVRCRSGASRGPRVSSRNRSSRRRSSSSGPSARIRAAASSSARGMPSSRVATAARARALPSVRAKPGVVSAARSTRRRTASLRSAPARTSISAAGALAGAGRLSGGTGHTRSPASPSGSWLVARTRSEGTRASSSAARSATAATNRSQLSTTSSQSRWCSAAASRSPVRGWWGSSEAPPRTSRSPRAEATASATRSTGSP